MNVPNKIKAITIKIISLCILVGITVILMIKFPINQPDTSVVPTQSSAKTANDNPGKSNDNQANKTLLFSFTTQNPEKLYSTGYTLSDQMFDRKTDKLILVDLSNDAYINNLPRVFINETNALPYLSPRMGFLYRYDTAGNKMLLSNDGKAISASLADKMVFVGERNKDGNALFTANGEYYTFSKENGGAFLKTSFDPLLEKRGIAFDYPSYYGADNSGNGIHLIYVNKRYGYANANGKVIVQPRYKAGYEFSEGIGCLIDALDRQLFFDIDGDLIMSPIYYGTKDENNSKYLGYFYFHNGIVRASTQGRSQLKKNPYPNSEVILKKDGSLLPIPSDYQVYAYSDGRILLGKAGYFGFMDANGAWVVDPVYPYAKPFCEGLAVVGTADGKRGVIDQNGILVIPMAFDGISDCSGGMITLMEKDLGWFAIQKLKLTAKVQ
jgi:hypothetical protein